MEFCLSGQTASLDWGDTNCGVCAAQQACKSHLREISEILFSVFGAKVLWKHGYSQIVYYYYLFLISQYPCLKNAMLLSARTKKKHKKQQSELIPIMDIEWHFQIWRNRKKICGQPAAIVQLDYASSPPVYNWELDGPSGLLLLSVRGCLK